MIAFSLDIGPLQNVETLTVRSMNEDEVEMEGNLVR